MRRRSSDAATGRVATRTLLLSRQVRPRPTAVGRDIVAPDPGDASAERTCSRRTARREEPAKVSARRCIQRPPTLASAEFERRRRLVDMVCPQQPASAYPEAASRGRCCSRPCPALRLTAPSPRVKVPGCGQRQDTVAGAPNGDHNWVWGSAQPTQRIGGHLDASLPLLPAWTPAVVLHDSGLDAGLGIHRRVDRLRCVARTGQQRPHRPKPLRPPPVRSEAHSRGGGNCRPVSGDADRPGRARGQVSVRTVRNLRSDRLR